MFLSRCCLAAAVALAGFSPLLAQKQFGFDNRRPSGQPYLKAEESVKRLKVPPGWEVQVFAAEPDVINPVAFTVDEKGRLWVVECFEYPRRTQKGKLPRDRIKVLQDTNGDGKADKVTLWAEGKDFPNREYPTAFDLATGIEVGHGGVFLGAAPFLFYLKDSKGSGKCDTHEILLRGFGSQDTHETLNTFQWGPDGRLYGLHGVFTQSKVGDVRMNAAVWRYDAPGKKFEIFAEGTSNPWGMDFDSRGQCFLACCVIPHLFHMVPGGTYKRQAGNSFNPYAYGLLNEICDHIHHRESGWAHAGLLYLDGDHVPAEYRGSLIMGSIHGCAIKRDVLRRNGSTFVASHGPDFLVSEDKNFRPINLRWGPNGEIYVIDWHDQNPCHQAPPNSWDQERGRIYVIRRKGAKKTAGVDLGKKSSKELVEALKNDNPWWYRTALRLLSERRDKSVIPDLNRLMASDQELHALRGLWGLYAVRGTLPEEVAVKLFSHKSPAIRLWAVRLVAESGKVSPEMLKTLVGLARTDPAPEVRLQLASTAQRLKDQDVLPILQGLMGHREDARDPDLPLMIWLAYEPRLTGRRNDALEWLKKNAPGNPLVADAIVPRTFRRLASSARPEDLAACVAFLGEVKDSLVRRRALDGLGQGLQNRQFDAPNGWRKTFASLMKDGDPEVRRLAQRLAVNFRDAQAVRRALAVLRDGSRSRTERLDAVRDLGLALPPEARKPLLDTVLHEKDQELRAEACRALAGYDSPEVATKIIDAWKDLPPALRTEAVNLLAGRKLWAQTLLSAVGKKQVPRTDLTDNTILRIRAFKDRGLNSQIQKVWGQFRDTPAELNALISRMRGELYRAPASFEHGRKVFENTCVKCHKFEGRGHEVGPNLDGAARDIEYLLVNVLDPNRVIGAPYFTRTVTLKSGRIEIGLLVAEDTNSITLKAENDARKVIQRKDIDELDVQPKSMMPEGLTKTMSVQDFRDLVRYVMAHPFLTQVAVAGPLSKDTRIDPAHPEQSGIRWQHPVVGVPGRIPLPATKETRASHVVAEVTAPERMRTRLMLGTAHPVEAWLNGKRVYQGKPGADEPDQVGVDVELQEGKNRLVFRIDYKGEQEALYARLLDPLRKLRYPENGGK
jgi:putative membrane-bound dehydrogenase-like protein